MRWIATHFAAIRRRLAGLLAPHREITRLRARIAQLEHELDDERSTIVVVAYRPPK